MKNEKIEIGTASKKSEWLRRHYQAFDAVELLMVGESYSLIAKDYRLDVLRDIASATVGKCILVIEWPEHGIYEVQRIEDNINPELFYRCQPGKRRDKTDCLGRLLELLKSYTCEPFEKFNSYDKRLNNDIKREGIITYTLIQRKLASIAVFRTSPNGATDELKVSIAKAIEEGYLSKINKDDLQERFDFRSRAYQINKLMFM